MNKKISFMICFVATLFFAFSSIVQAEELFESFRLVVLGDSLSSGYNLPKEESYIVQLQNTLINDGLDNVEVINAAVSGNKTSDGLAMMKTVLEQRPHAAIIELGANDLLQEVPAKQIEQNLESIIGQFLDNDIPVMLIGIRLPLTQDLKGREELNAIYKKLVKKYKLVFYPHFLEGVLIERLGAYDFKYMQNDTVHPNAEGVKIMVKKTYPKIKKFLMSL